MIPENRTETLALVALVAVLFFAGFFLGIAVALDGDDPPALAEATILDVYEVSEWTEPRTLLQMEDGTRRTVRAYYGEPGDTFLLPVTQ